MQWITTYNLPWRWQLVFVNSSQGPQTMKNGQSNELRLYAILPTVKQENFIWVITDHMIMPATVKTFSPTI